MVENKHEYFLANPFGFHWENRFPCFCRNLFDILKLMVLVVMILAIRVNLEGMDVSWFGESSNLMSWQEHFSVLEMRLAISIELARVGEDWKRVKGCGCDRNRKVKGGDNGGKGSETSSRKRGKGRLYHSSTESKRHESLGSVFSFIYQEKESSLSISPALLY